MTYDSMILDDFLLRDDLQPITITNPGTDPPTEIHNIQSLVSFVNSRSMIVGGIVGMELTDIDVTFRVCDLDDSIPERGWNITLPNNDVYTITSIEFESFGTEKTLCRCVGKINYENTDSG